MARRSRVLKKEIKLDPRFGDPIVNQFMNYVMEQGKKATAAKIVYKAMERAGELNNSSDLLATFLEAIEAVRPQVEVKSRRIGGATYQVPVEVRRERSTSLAIRWLVRSARKRSEKTMIERLAHEFVDAIKGRGGAMKNRETAQKMAEANRAFAHLRW